MRTAGAKIVSSNPIDGGLGVLTFISASTLSASFSTPAVNKEGIFDFSVTINTNNVVGTGSIWASNDVGSPWGEAFTGSLSPYYVGNWAPVSNMTQFLSGANQEVMFNLQNQGYRWFKVEWDHVSGTGSMDVTWNGIGR